MRFYDHTASGVILIRAPLLRELEFFALDIALAYDGLGFFLSNPPKAFHVACPTSNGPLWNHYP